MDPVVNQLARDVVDAISAAVADDPRVEACRERAREAGYERITLCVDRENEGAIRLYEKHGFQRVRDDGSSLTMVASIAEPTTTKG